VYQSERRCAYAKQMCAHTRLCERVNFHAQWSAAKREKSAAKWSLSPLFSMRHRAGQCDNCVERNSYNTQLHCGDLKSHSPQPGWIQISHAIIIRIFIQLSCDLARIFQLVERGRGRKAWISERIRKEECIIMKWNTLGQDHLTCNLRAPPHFATRLFLPNKERKYYDERARTIFSVRRKLISSPPLKNKTILAVMKFLYILSSSPGKIIWWKI
jgi:hypothetical protein